MNNVGLAAHRFEAACPACSPVICPVARRTVILAAGPAGLSCLDNGSAYRSAIHAIACRALQIKHLRTRPRRPQTNGKAERFIRTMLGGWAYGAVYRSSAERTPALEGWPWRYDYRRKHGALGRRPPAARLAELNNALGSYT
jgi:transposase InsO family protein